MGLPRAKQGSWLWATLKRPILELLADGVTRGKGCRLHVGRLRMLGRKRFCKGDAQPQVGTKGRVLQAWGFAEQKAVEDLMS